MEGKIIVFLLGVLQTALLPQVSHGRKTIYIVVYKAGRCLHGYIVSRKLSYLYAISAARSSYLHARGQSTQLQEQPPWRK